MNPLGCVLLLAFFLAPIFGQIAIDWTEIPQNIGIAFTHNGAESVNVNIGSPGGPQMWSFTTQPMGAQSADVLIVPREFTPYGDSFPNANVVLQITTLGSTVYAYSQVTPSFRCALGAGSLSPVMFYRFDPPDSIPLPIVYGGTRHYYSSGSVAYAPNVVIRTDDFGYETIDAYGSVTVPYGAFECLRVQYYDTLVMTTFVYGIPVAVDTTTSIKYDFLAEDYDLITHVLSYAGETNPNFNNAQLLERLTAFSTGINELKQLALGEFSCHPNPFTQTTNIRCMIHDAGYMIENPTLNVYDASGRLVKSFNHESCIPGLAPRSGAGMDHESIIIWHGDDDDGRRLPAGVYFVRMTDAGTVFTGKVLLIR